VPNPRFLIDVVVKPRVRAHCARHAVQPMQLNDAPAHRIRFATGARVL
jgi:hypothetical protein